MANEIHVLFHGPLPKTAALARALRDLDFPVSIPKPTGSLEQQKGFMPMRLYREDTGVEFDVFDGRDAVEEIAGQHVGLIDPALDRVANFRWGGNEDEMVCAMCGAAALAGLVSGAVTAEDDCGTMPPDKAVAVARKVLAGMKPPDNHFGTRPAHIKRYLKPLLKQRSDLVKVGNCLLIRPVRHLVRGVRFDRTSDKYVFRLWPHIEALYAPNGGVGYGKDYVSDYACEVWRPHFQALLIERLPGDVLTDLGAMTTLEDLLDCAGRWSEGALLRTWVLAGRRDEADAFVRRIEQKASTENSLEWAKALREFITRDIDAICAEAHTIEAATAEKWKLTEFWEPSPFPVELPPAQRPGRSAEPLFLTTPWPQRPSWLLQPMPDQPGEIQYAKDIYRRGEQMSLLVPLTREEAKARHESFEDYVLAVRTTGDRLIVLERRTCAGDRINPSYDRLSKAVSRLMFTLQAREHWVHAWLPAPTDDLLALFSLRVLVDRGQRCVWSCTVWDDLSKITIGYEAPGGRQTVDRPPTEAERELLTGALPAFGQFDMIADHMLTLVRIAGFGEIH